jgi:hypothetical protein
MEMEIEINTRKTELEWQKSIDRFWISFAQKWFEWMGWILILGALHYATIKVSTPGIKQIYYFSYVVFFLYFQSFFYQFEIKFSSPNISKKKIRVISLLLSGSIGTVVYLILSQVISALKIANL